MDMMVNSNDILSCIPEIITMDDNLALMAVPSIDEIKVAVFDLDPLSALGPDGFPGIFYRYCWGIVGPEVCLAVQNFFSEIVAMRISILLPRLISEEQGAFQRGKIISSNICMASELANLMHSKSFGRGLALKLDIKKAFDNLDWVSLFDVMHKFGFSQLFIDHLHQIFLSSKLSVLINGGPVGFFGLGHGLHQGDPLSPILFIIAEEVFCRGISLLKMENKFYSLPGPRNVFSPSHLLYADDIFVFIIVELTFNEVFGQVPKVLRSGYQYGKKQGEKRFSLEKISTHRKRRLKEVINIPECKLPTRYLGVEIFRSKLKRDFLLPLVDKFKSRLFHLSKEPRSELELGILEVVRKSMDLIEKESAEELFHAQAHIWNQMLAFINSLSLKCAVELGIPNIVYNHQQPITLPELVKKLAILKTKTACLLRHMRLLVHFGFFYQQEEGYVLTPSSRLRLKDTGKSVSPFLQAILDPILITPWHFLSAWFQGNGLNPFKTVDGKTLWGYVGEDSELNKFFNKAMASDARLVISVVANLEGKGYIASVLDVGGVTGTVAKTIVETFPSLKCTVLDLPHVVANLEGNENLTYIAGDMFESIPPADAVLLKWILHDWTDEQCIKILKGCKEAISSGDREGNLRKVIIIDMVVEDRKEEHKFTETQLFFDMLVMTLVVGKERTKKEWEKLFLESGFTHYKITPLLGLRSLIEVYP
ncbi:uncharacterized protein LOC122067618 [Macadamia integrifolia]|uniref:uncharacterized protein LOC122067618 n=1 Tax=Macadamia integrifolia TaxID=60698 RepID=UPI001C4ECFDE|nr:uncharacterized protein LOC122067618 [Macadamia integrifolia]